MPYFWLEFLSHVHHSLQPKDIWVYCGYYYLETMKMRLECNWYKLICSDALGEQFPQTVFHLGLHQLTGALLLVLWGGFVIGTSQGNENKKRHRQSQREPKAPPHQAAGLKLNLSLEWKQSSCAWEHVRRGRAFNLTHQSLSLVTFTYIEWCETFSTQ